MKTISKTTEFFGNGESYAIGIEQWVKNSYRNANPYKQNDELKFTFPYDFAIADWYGEEGIRDTYDRVKESWLGDYKAWTEVVITLSWMSWAHWQLQNQGFPDQDRFIKLYADLYEKASIEFYKKYENNKKAVRHYHEMTD